MANKRIRARSSLFLVLSTVLILLVGTLTVFWHTQTTRADGGYVVGPPTLPAETVDHILASMGSPMVGTGSVIEQAARDTNIDDAFALGVWYTETNDGAAGVGLGDRNPGSVKGGAGYPVAYDGYTIYPGYAAAVVDWFNLLKTRYISRGLTTVYSICYPYVGTAGASRWAGKVTALMLHYQQLAPPPTPAPMPSPTPTPISHNYVRNHSQINALSDTMKPSVDSYQETKPGVNTFNTSKTSTDQSTPITQPMTTNSSMSPTNEKMLAGLVLLLAAFIALLGVRVRRHIVLPALEAWTATKPAFNKSASHSVSSSVPAVLTLNDSNPQTSTFSPVYVNEYSPAAQPQTAPLQPLSPTFSGTIPLVRPTPVLSFSHSDLPDSATVPGTDNGGPHPVPLSPAHQLRDGSGERHTEGIPPYRSSVSLSGTDRTPVGVKGSGLLQRYGDNENKKTGQN